MTKIKTYTIKSPVVASDKWIGSNGVTGETKNFSAEGVATFVASTLTPIDGGLLKVTEIEIDTLDTDIATTVNVMTPSYDVDRYEVLFFMIEGVVYVLKVMDITIGVGGETLTNDDFITFPINTGEAGANADMTRTSTDSIAIAGSGSKTLTYTASTNLGWAVGTRLRFANSISNYMEGAITAVSSTSVTITVDNSAGSGTLASWTISIAGDKGSAGSTGANGTNADMTRTSVTSNAIANSGSKTFAYTASTNLGWLVGTRLRFANDPSNYMEGTVTAVSSTSVTATMDNSVGSGTYIAWNIGIAGDKGDSGTPNAIVIEDTGGSLVITAQDTANLDYDISFQLDGTKCFYTGTITNNTAGTLTNQDVFAFINSSYYTRSTYDIISLGLNGGGIIRRILLHGTLLSIEEIEPAEVIEISGWYFTN